MSTTNILHDKPAILGSYDIQTRFWHCPCLNHLTVKCYFLIPYDYIRAFIREIIRAWYNETRERLYENTGMQTITNRIKMIKLNKLLCVFCLPH